MTHGVCNLTVIPLRKEPAHQSEMVSQVLFGEHFEVIEKSGNWCRVRLAFDLYEGWVSAGQFEPVNLEEFSKLNKEQYCVSFDLVQIMLHENSLFSIVLG